jgi:TOMM system kinase/cyclase fusion protein
MEFEAVLEQTIALLQRQGRISYGALKRRFQLDDTYLEDLKVELIEAQRLAYDENGRILVWAGETISQAPTRDDQSPQVPLIHVERRAPDAERRQLTVMFCDLVDSTLLASQLDPEDWREVVRAYQETATAVIQRFDGHIAQYLGDGLLVYFGYPQAHEDDARRAVRTGLDVVEALGALNARLAQRYGVRLAVRIGIHTGMVVVGEMGGGSRQEQLALGDTPNVAARIQGLAAPDTVVISPATFRLVQGYFLHQDLGTHALKGLTTPVQVYRILGDSAAQSRLDVVDASGLTPLVGRDSEVALLLERWAHSQDGRGQVVLLSGEPGIGKSRLVEVLRERVIRQGATRMVFRCSPYHQQSALFPVIEHVQRVVHWQHDAPLEVRVDALEQALQRSRLSLEEVVPLLAALLSLPHPAHYPPLNLTPQRQRQKTYDALVAWLLAEAEQQPVLAVWEDLHWADPSTLELLGLVLDQVPTARMLTLLTCRPEFLPPWASRSHLTQVTLTRLGRPQVQAMITSLTGGKTLPAAVVEHIVARTDGVPLFVEELVKMILESGLVREEGDHYVLTGPLPPLAIPSTLHDSLMARLDRLATVKEVAQLGATLGRTFAYELLQAVSPLDEATLQQGLRQLVEAELVYQRGTPPQATYMFKHALIQETAYQSLLRSTRQQFHQRIAQVLEARFPATVETQPELLAHHYTEAGLAAQAVVYWQRAGERAVERSANVEAISHLTTALTLLPALPDTPERTQHELTLLTVLGIPLVLTKGHAAPEVEATYARARTLCQQLGDTPQLFSVLLGLRRMYFMRAEYQTAHAVGEQLLRLAERLDDAGLCVRAHMMLAEGLLYLGEFAPARAHAEQGIALYDPQRHRVQVVHYGNDPGVCCRLFAALALWVLGYPDQAQQRSEEALAWAQELAHPFSLAFALIHAARLHQDRREGALTYTRAEAGIALATAQGFVLFLAHGPILRGWALAEQGQAAEGLAQIRQGIAAKQVIGVESGRSYNLALLADVYGKVGQLDEGLRVLTEAQTVAQATGERFYEAELSRLTGELLRAQSSENHAAAEACFQQALDVAHRQQAKSWELRAAMSLSRLWQRQGKRGAAYQLLAEVYGWFTEGFDTADLQEAKALLAQLA